MRADAKASALQIGEKSLFYVTFRRTPGEGSPHFDRFDGQNFTFPALLEGTGVSTSAEVDLGLLALRTIDNFLIRKLLKEFLLWVLRQARADAKASALRL